MSATAIICIGGVCLAGLAVMAVVYAACVLSGRISREEEARGEW